MENVTQVATPIARESFSLSLQSVTDAHTGIRSRTDKYHYHDLPSSLPSVQEYLTQGRSAQVHAGGSPGAIHSERKSRSADGPANMICPTEAALLHRIVQPLRPNSNVYSDGLGALLALQTENARRVIGGERAASRPNPLGQSCCRIRSGRWMEPITLASSPSPPSADSPRPHVEVQSQI